MTSCPTAPSSAGRTLVCAAGTGGFQRLGFTRATRLRARLAVDGGRWAVDGWPSAASSRPPVAWWCIGVLAILSEGRHSRRVERFAGSWGGPESASCREAGSGVGVGVGVGLGIGVKREGWGIGSAATECVVPSRGFSESSTGHRS